MNAGVKVDSPEVVALARRRRQQIPVGRAHFDMAEQREGKFCALSFVTDQRLAVPPTNVGTRRWLTEHWLIGPVIRTPQHQTNPLFRQASMDRGK